MDFVMAVVVVVVVVMVVWLAGKGKQDSRSNGGKIILLLGNPYR